MPKKKEQPAEKQPAEMTSEELLDYVVAPKVAEKLKEFVRKPDDPEQPADSDDLS